MAYCQSYLFRFPIEKDNRARLFRLHQMEDMIRYLLHERPEFLDILHDVPCGNIVTRDGMVQET